MKQDVGSLRTTQGQALATAGRLLHDETLARILHAVGARHAGAFLDQLHADLTAALGQLQIARDQADRIGMQRASHCLIALAGTIGATDLEYAARALNTDAHATGGTGCVAAAPVVSEMTARLLDELCAYRVTMPTSESPQK